MQSVLFIDWLIHSFIHSIHATPAIALCPPTQPQGHDPYFGIVSLRAQSYLNWTGLSYLNTKHLYCDGLHIIKRVRRLCGLCCWAFYLQIKATLLWGRINCSIYERSQWRKDTRTVVPYLWGKHNAWLLSRKGERMGVEDPAEAAVALAVNCIWDYAHISFDLICTSNSPAGV